MQRGRLKARIWRMLGQEGGGISSPSMRISGRRQIVLENHISVSEFTDKSIRVRTSDGQIRICGSGIVIDGLGMNGIVISGEFDSIEFS